LDPGPPTRSRAPIAIDVAAAASEAKLADLTAQMSHLKGAGRLVLEIPLEAVAADHLTRDRIGCDTEEMAALVESLRQRGQQTPVEVEALEAGRYGLISGWRRLTALHQLHAETSDRRFATVLAVLRAPETAAEAYVAMVEENEIRSGLSLYERARIVAKAVDQGVYPDTRAALRGLFASVTRSKRSKIGSFLPIVAALDGVLSFPTALPERLGLALSKALEGDPDLGARLAARLAEHAPQTFEEERACLMAGLAPPAERPQPAPVPAPVKVDLVEIEGGVALQGPGVTPAFRRALAAWLRARQDMPRQR